MGAKLPGQLVTADGRGGVGRHGEEVAAARATAFALSSA
jgi:hypothetical protein